MEILLAVVIVLAGWGWYFIRRDSRKISGVFAELAANYKGTVRKVLASYPQLELDYDGAKLTVSVIHGANGPFTYLTCRVGHWTGVNEFVIVSRAMPTYVIDSHRALTEHKTRDSHFDDMFVTRCNDAGMIKSLLNPELRSLLLELNGGKSTEVRFLKERDDQNSYRFNLDVEKILTDSDDYERLIRTGLQILGRINPQT